MRTRDELKHHYEVEKSLANRLREASPADRGQLYGLVYNELFRRLPNHPQLTRKQDEASQQAAVDERWTLVKRFLRPETVFLEVGAGDCSLSRRAAERVAKCYALDVSREILAKSACNMEAVLSDGCSVPIPADTVTVAYSYQVMEHIHPDDAREQLHNIIAALAPGGKYVCVTPNRLNGPHDISQFFDDVAQGLHLKEYTVTELVELFRRVGFQRVDAYVGFSHRYFRMPVWILTALERLLGWVPARLRRRIGNLRGVQNLLFVSVAATK